MQLNGFFGARLGTLLAMVCAGVLSIAPTAGAAPNIESSVVKVFAMIRPPDLSRPWLKPQANEVTGSGVVIEGRRILTNAHVVSYASEIQIQGSEGGDRLSAKVAFVAPGIDLAVLTLDDDKFFANHPPLARTNALPDAKDAVLAYGFPAGGQTLSITKGIVSRTEFVSYNFPTSGLRVQIDAAINPGNSGGPAVVGDKMVGLAFSRLGNAENIGYIIPNEEIELFLKDIADGHYDGKPALFTDFQTLGNPALRAFLKLPEDTRGVVVNSWAGEGDGSPLKKWDVITKIAGVPIDDDGDVAVTGNLRVRFTYLIQKRAVDGHVTLSIIRGGKPMDVQVPVAADRPMLIPNLQGTYPPYFIYGPVVFSIATQPAVQGLMQRPEIAALLSIMRSPLITERGSRPSQEHEELVMVSSAFFPHRLAKNYSNHMGAVVSTVNGTPIRSLKHLVEVLRDLKDESVVIEFEGRGIESLVFPHKEMLSATDAILTDNGVRAQGSAELIRIWSAKDAH
jgi:S1-C subfamily serine protease